MSFLFVVIGFLLGVSIFQEYMYSKNKKPECKMHKWERKEGKMTCVQCTRSWGED